MLVIRILPVPITNGGSGRKLGDSMEIISSNVKKIIINTLQARGAKLPCPRCGTNNFTLLDGYFTQPVQQDLKAFSVGPSVPSVVVICNQCGYMSQHALGALGLMPAEETVNNG